MINFTFWFWLLCVEWTIGEQEWKQGKQLKRFCTFPGEKWWQLGPGWWWWKWREESHRCPLLAQARFLPKLCHQSVLTNLQYMGACPYCGALLESPLPRSLLQTMPVLQELSDVVSTFRTAHSHIWFFSMAWLLSGPFLEMPPFVLLSCFLPLESKCFVGICWMVSTGLLWKLHL